MNSSAPSGSENITGCEGGILDSNSTEASVVTVFLIIISIITAPVTGLLNGLFRKSNLQAQEVEMRVNGVREGLEWRSQNTEQESVTNSTNRNQKTSPQLVRIVTVDSPFN